MEFALNPVEARVLGCLIEKELAFRAQDRAGNVWHLGEYTETWEGEDLVGGQAFPSSWCDWPPHWTSTSHNVPAH